MSVEGELTGLLDCMAGSLAAAGWTGELCLTPSMPSLETCCSPDGSGFAWARLVRMFPTRNFPQEDYRNADFNCSPPAQWATVVELGATVCICDDTCSCEVKTRNASDVLKYLEAGLSGVVCCLADESCAGPEFFVVNASPIRQQANCGGFTIELVKQHYMDCCPPAGESP